MAFDRNKFKPASLQANKDLSKKTEDLTKNSSSSDGRPGYHKIEEGTNIFRICPPHNPDEPSFQPKCIVWLPQEVEEVKDDKKTGKKVISNRPIFNSRVHGGTPKDLIDEYIAFAFKNVYEAIQDKDERAKKMAPITGWRGKDGKWNAGIRPSTSYVFYAFKNNKLARLELYPADRNRMEELNINEEAEEPIMTDSFSDPNEGISLVIVRGKNDKGKMENVLKKREFNGKKMTWDEFIKSEALTDEQLMELEKAPSLKELYNSFKRSDFEKQLSGLKIFDENNGFNFLENDEFLDIVQEIDAYYPEEDEKEKTTSSTEDGPEDDEVEDIQPKGKLDGLDRTALKAYIKENGLSLQVMKSMTDDMIRELILEAESKMSGDEPEGSDEVEDPSDPKDLPWEGKDRNAVEDKRETVSAPTAATNKLAEMRARMSKKS